MQQIYRSHALESVTEVVRNPDSFPPHLAPSISPAHLAVEERNNSTADDAYTVHNKTAALQPIATSAERAADAKGVTDFDMSRISKYFMTVKENDSQDESNLSKECTASRQCTDISAIIKTKASSDGSVDALQRPTRTRTRTITSTAKDTGGKARIKAGMGHMIKLENKAVAVDGASVVAGLNGHDPNQIDLFNDGVEGSYSKLPIGRSLSLHADIIEDNRFIGIHHESQSISQPLYHHENLKKKVSAKEIFSMKDTDLSSRLNKNGHENRHLNGHGNGHENAHEDQGDESSDDEEECDKDWDWGENALNTCRSDSPHRDWNGYRGQVQGLLDWTMDLDPDTV